MTVPSTKSMVASRMKLAEASFCCGTPVMVIEVVEPDPIFDAMVVVFAVLSIVTVVVVVPWTIVKTCWDVPAVESVTVALPST